MIDSQEMQNGCVQVVNADAIDDGLMADVVGFAIEGAAFDAGLANLLLSMATLSCTFCTWIVVSVAIDSPKLIGTMWMVKGIFTPLPVSR